MLSLDRVSDDWMFYDGCIIFINVKILRSNNRNNSRSCLNYNRTSSGIFLKDDKLQEMKPQKGFVCMLTLSWSPSFLDEGVKWDPVPVTSYVYCRYVTSSIYYWLFLYAMLKSIFFFKFRATTFTFTWYLGQTKTLCPLL